MNTVFVVKTGLLDCSCYAILTDYTDWGRKVSGMDREKKKRMHIAYMQINSLNHL